MKEEEIIEILNDWNFWKKEIDTGIKRETYVTKALEFLKTNMIITMTGIRRSGKSFLIRQIAKELSKEIPKNEILIVNFEDRRFGSLNDSDLDKIFEVYCKYLNPKNKPYVFLDEVHRVKNWERWVRTYNELGKAKILVSGSTSHLIKENFSTLLTGRHLDIEVFPLSFKEFLKFKGVEIKDRLDVISKKIEIKRALDEYMEFGGFPEVVLSNQKKEILVTYFDDIIARDVVQRYRVLKVDELFKLAKFYMTNISSPITYNSLKKFTNLAVDTIEAFSRYLETVYLVFFVKRFSPRLKEQEKSPRKVYSIDTGLSNAVGFRFLEKKGQLMENLVAIELLRRKSLNPLLEIYYFKDYQQREVDFVVKEETRIKQLIQVTYASGKDDIKEREIKALLKASELLKCNDLLVITWDYENEEKINRKKVKFIPLWKWLLAEKVL